MLVTDIMDANLIRHLTQRRLQDGRLPHGHSVELWFGPGTGICDGCGTAMTAHQRMVVRIDFQGWRELRFHEACFEIWDDERVKGAAA